MVLTAQELSASSFQPFGQVIAAPSRTPTASPAGMEYWADVARLPELGRPYAIGYATQELRPFRQSCAERHMKTPELLFVAGGDMVVIVGPADHPSEPSRLPTLAAFAAFRVEEGSGVLFGPGVWHWAPFAVSRPIRLLVVYSAGTAESDAVVADFPGGGYLEVRLPS
jgi:ureidoglycolate hydrolase